MNQGWSSAKATLALLDVDEPATIESLTVGFHDNGRHKGNRDLDMEISWPPVVEDVLGNGTGIKGYHWAARPRSDPAKPVEGTGGGLPLPAAQGGGWREGFVGEPKDGDGLEDPPGTSVVVRSLTHHPFRVTWDIKVRAEDYLGQLGAWKTVTGVRANLTGPPNPQSVVGELEQQFSRRRGPSPTRL